MWGSKQVRWVFWDWILGRNEGVNFESDMGSSSMVRKGSWVREKEKGLCRQVLSADTYTHFHTCSVRHTHTHLSLRPSLCHGRRSCGPSAVDQGYLLTFLSQY